MKSMDKCYTNSNDNKSTKRYDVIDDVTTELTRERRGSCPVTPESDGRGQTAQIVWAPGEEMGKHWLEVLTLGECK